MGRGRFFSFYGDFAAVVAVALLGSACTMKINSAGSKNPNGESRGPGAFLGFDDPVSPDVVITADFAGREAQSLSQAASALASSCSSGAQPVVPIDALTPGLASVAASFPGFIVGEFSNEGVGSALASVDQGFYLSADQGQNWKKLLTLGNEYRRPKIVYHRGYFYVLVVDLAASPSVPSSQLLRQSACSGERFGEWENLSAGLPTIGFFGQSQIEAFYGDGDQELYISDPEGTYTSTDGGFTWTKRSGLRLSGFLPTAQGLLGFYGFPEQSRVTDLVFLRSRDGWLPVEHGPRLGGASSPFSGTPIGSNQVLFHLNWGQTPQGLAPITQILNVSDRSWQDASAGLPQNFWNGSQLLSTPGYVLMTTMNGQKFWRSVQAGSPWREIELSFGDAQYLRHFSMMDAIESQSGQIIGLGSIYGSLGKLVYDPAADEWTLTAYGTQFGSGSGSGSAEGSGSGSGSGSAEGSGDGSGSS